MTDETNPGEDRENPLLKRKSDTLLGMLKRLDIVEHWAVHHQENHQDEISKAMERFMSTDNFVCLVKRMWQHDEIKTAVLTVKNQMVGEIVSAIFSNRLLWLFCAVVVLMLLGFDLRSIKEILKSILI